MRLLASFVISGLSVLAIGVKALNPIEASGQDFVDSATGLRFQVVGVDYQPGGEAGYDPAHGQDPLTDVDTCIRDAALMQGVGFNTIRVYNVNPDLNHDECVSIFNAVGIYMLIDVNSPLDGESINRDAPANSYTLSYLRRVFRVIDAFRGYPNLVGFFSANEIINDWRQAGTGPPYMRAVTRDMKQYMAAQSGRRIPVGYSATDFRPALADTSNYLQCESEGDPDSRSDFFALNSYSWCGDATFQSSTYSQLARDFADFSMPVFLSEYGCIEPRPRIFTEVPAIYGPRFSMFSGGLVYQWTEEENEYGLVNIKNDGSVQIISDLDNLEGQYNSVDFTQLESLNSTARSLEPPTCRPQLIEDRRFYNDFDLPSAPNGVQALMYNGAGGRVGSIVSVTKTAVQVVVTQVGGSTSRGLTITRVSTVNRPQPGGTGTSSNSGSTPTSDNAAAGGKGELPSELFFGLQLASLLAWLLL